MKRPTYATFLTVVLACCLFSCSEDISTNTQQQTLEKNLSIDVRWHSGSFDQTQAQVKTGIAWGLSYLGASLPDSSLDQTIMEMGERLFHLDLTKAGFSEEAESALSIIINELEASEEYQVNGSIAIGRLIMLTLCSSNHYYAITRVTETIDDFKSSFDFNGTKIRVINSSIAKVQRLVDIAEANDMDEIAYISAEGPGAFQDNSFEAEEFETLEFMPNGQLRFALYDSIGLKDAGDPELTCAGKPSKCLWCHETIIQPLFRPGPVLAGDGFLDKVEFSVLRMDQMAKVDSVRAMLNGAIDFNKRQDHTLMEYLYIDFMEPTLERVAEELGLSIEETTVLLAGLETHPKTEQNNIMAYDRKDIDPFLPYATTEVPSSAREYSVYEPNFF